MPGILWMGSSLPCRGPSRNIGNPQPTAQWTLPRKLELPRGQLVSRKNRLKLRHQQCEQHLHFLHATPWSGPRHQSWTSSGSNSSGGLSQQDRAQSRNQPSTPTEEIWCSCSRCERAVFQPWWPHPCSCKQIAPDMLLASRVSPKHQDWCKGPARRQWTAESRPRYCP